jgi:hypothetical protein
MGDRCLHVSIRWRRWQRQFSRFQCWLRACSPKRGSRLPEGRWRYQLQLAMQEACGSAEVGAPPEVQALERVQELVLAVQQQACRPAWEPAPEVLAPE